MFETLCALLLRIYPAGFRGAYGPDAVQLIRDRARHERGLFLRLRLLMDLAMDLFAMWLRGWEPIKPLIARADGAPRFDLIEGHGPRPRALATGMLASIFILASFTLLFQAAPPPVAIAQFGGSGFLAPQQAAASDSEPRLELVSVIATYLKQFYVHRPIGQQVADALLAHKKNGAYATLGTGAALAARINSDIQTASRALGIPRGVFVADVVYSPQPLPTGPPPPMTEEMRERNRAAMLQQNCLFETIETLPRNVGYLKLNGFGDGATCRETTGRAMASLNNADALIVDLRDNGGGFGDTALQIAAYLFDRPAYMYDPRPNSPVPARTSSPISGNKLFDKPVYVLTSSRTQSAAEYFAYNLKMLKRATVVGETTAGHQHSGAFHRINDHFGIGIQETVPSANPYPVKGWEVIGVEPDVKVSRSEALDAATKLAQSRRLQR
jgi:hypothetical protein